MIQAVSFVLVLVYSGIAAWTLDDTLDRVVEDPRRSRTWLASVGWSLWCMFAAYAWPVYWAGRALTTSPDVPLLPPGSE